MKNVISICAAASILLFAMYAYAENDSNNRQAEQQRDIIVFAIDSELIWAYNTVYNVWKRSLIYDGTAYIPLYTILEAYGGSFSVSDN